MAFQHYYEEMKILLNRIENFNFSGWTAIYKSVQLMIEGDLAAAENILRAVQNKNGDWFIYANLGRIFEAQRSFARALEQYELAAEIISGSIADNSTAASIIFFRIARCLTALSRPVDAVPALQQAVELNPNNHTARLELDRLLSN